ncbi:MAG: methyltransferase domain-containing protein [Chloroflexota bacterium]
MHTYKLRQKIRANVLNTIVADPRFVGCVDYGSASEGRDDEWSDIDLAFFVRDESLDEINRHWKSWASQFGTPLLMYMTKFDHPWVVYEAEPIPLRADFAFHPESKLDMLLDWPNSPISVEAMVLYDNTGGRLTQIVSQIVGQDLGPQDLQQTFERVCGDFWYYMLRIEARIRRGELWGAAWQFSEIVIVNLCALLRIQHHALERFRGSDPTVGIAKVITPEQLHRLNRCVTGPNEDELRRVLIEAAQLGREVCGAIVKQHKWEWPEQLAIQVTELNRTALTSQDVIALYDGAAERYDELVESTNYIGPNWFSRQLKTISLPPDLHFLDCGCANGINAKAMLKNYPEATAVGIDISPKMVNAASQTDLYKELFTHDLSHPLSFLPPDKFDLVIAFGCLEFLTSPQAFLGEMHRVLRKNGEWMLSLQLYVEGRADAPRMMRSGTVIHHAYSEAEISRMITTAGLDLISTEEVVGYTGGAPCPYLMVQGRKR